MEKKRLLSLFSGCGGMDLGFEGNFEVFKESINTKINEKWIEQENKKTYLLKETIFDTVFANDNLNYAKNAWLINFMQRGKDENVFHSESIVDLVRKSHSGEFTFPENIDVVTGGFPCQDFSVAGKRNGFNSHRDHNGMLIQEPTVENRGLLYIWMKNVINIVKPKVFIAENVKGLVSLENAKTIIENDFRNIDNGYLVVPSQVLNAKNYGIPQNRERIIFIGFNKRYLKKEVAEELEKGFIDNELNPYPQITHSEFYNLNPPTISPVKLSEILHDLPEPHLEKHDLSHIHYSKAKYYGKMQGNTEVNLNSVGPTIRAEHHGNIEFRRLAKKHGGKYQVELKKGMSERRLSVRECARIQTFPDNFVFVNNHPQYRLSASGAYKVIGNALPPLLAYHIAKRLESLWDNYFRR